MYVVYLKSVIMLLFANKFFLFVICFVTFQLQWDLVTPSMLQNICAKI